MDRRSTASVLSTYPAHRRGQRVEHQVRADGGGQQHVAERRRRSHGGVGERDNREAQVAAAPEQPDRLGRVAWQHHREHRRPARGTGLLQVIITGRDPDLRMELRREERQVLGERRGYPRPQDGQRPGSGEQLRGLLDPSRLRQRGPQPFQVGDLGGDRTLVLAAAA
jgi:hypothetical protein